VADNVADMADISDMPDPTTIGLKQAAPADDMPAPEDLYRKYRGLRPTDAVAPGEVAEFMKNPPDPNWKPPTLHSVASQLTGLPRAAAGYALAVPAGVASIAGQLTGAGGAALDPTNAADYLEQGRERGRKWAEGVNNLTNYVPATKRGAEFANDLTGLPANLIKETAGAGLKAALPDNAYQAVSDVAQDIGTDLPALGAPAAVRATAKGVSKAAGAAKNFAASEAATTTAPGDMPAAPIVPPVGKPITGDTLRAQPNPIPAPEGTAHRVATEEGRSPAAPPSRPPAEPQPATPALPEADTAPQNMSLSPEQRAVVREGVAARRAAAESQRGSVRLFNSPADEGPQETPAPEQQSERAAHLDAIDKLSGGGLPTRRASALTGDYNATGDDFQMKEVGSQPMRQQIASENAAMHKATENVHDSVGSEFENSVDSQTLGDRGRVTRGAIQGIEKWFGDATDQMYNAARTANEGRPIPKLQRVSDYLNDDSNFTNDAEIGLQRAAKQRLERLWTTGDPDKGVPPGSVNAAEKFREFLNDKGKNPSAMGVASEMKGHLDMDVADHGGPGLFETARALRRHSYQMLEEPQGIKKLLAPADSQGINHAIPEHKVMDYIADLPRDQHEHVLNVLRAGAHLGSGELADASAGALREIQAHVISRMHAAATNADGSWNARKFYNAADRYARNASDTFRDRPDVLQNLKTINDAGNTLHMDKHYPGAGAQIERTGMAGRVVQGVGGIAASIAHEIPMGGRMVGRAIERGVEKAGGQMSEAARDKAVQSRLVDRTGKQRGSVQLFNDNKLNRQNEERTTFHGKDINPRNERNERVANQQMGGRRPLTDEQNDVLGRLMGGRQRGAVGDLSQRGAVSHEVEDAPSLGLRYHSYSTPHGGGLDVREVPGLDVRKAYRATQPTDQRGKGWGTRTLQRAVDDAHAAGQKFQSDSQVSDSQAGAYSNLKKLGYDVKMKPNEHVQGEYKAHGDHVFEVRPGKPKGYEAPDEHPRIDKFQGMSLRRPSADVNVSADSAFADGDYHVQPGVREVPMSSVPKESLLRSDHLYQNPKDQARISDLAAQIKKNNSIEPLFLAQRADGSSYLAEGAHRIRALQQLGHDSFPARVMVEGKKAKHRGSVQVMNDEDAPRSEEEGSQLNVGLHQGQEGENGFRKMSKQEAQAAVESTGAKVTKNTVLTPKQHGVFEPTAVISTDRPISDYAMQGVLAKTKQSAIPQRTGQGNTSMHVAPGHEEIAKKEGWDQFNPDYFREHNGKTMSDSTKKEKR
jgi:hypothetical protein